MYNYFEQTKTKAVHKCKVTVMSECLGKEFVFQGHELGAWFWAQCVKSHEKSLKHLKCFGKLGWILKIKCICQSEQEAACFGQISKIGKDWYSLNDDSYCIWFTADIYAHILHFQVFMNSGLCIPLWDKRKYLRQIISFVDEQQKKKKKKTALPAKCWFSQFTLNVTLAKIAT